jgi:hypothetical protein
MLIALHRIRVKPEMLRMLSGKKWREEHKSRHKAEPAETRHGRIVPGITLVPREKVPEVNFIPRRLPLETEYST